MTDTECDICRAAPAVRYSLVRHHRAEGRMRSDGSGGIDLCAACWERVAAPRMRSKRQETET